MPFVLASTRSLSFCFWSNVRDRMLCLDWQVFVHISSMHFVALEYDLNLIEPLGWALSIKPILFPRYPRHQQYNLTI